jgi:ADP-heptose:LPS heptosyltransferase
LDNQIKKIIVIIPFRGIGDVIFHIPLLRALFFKYKKKLIIISNQVNHSNEIFKNEIFYDDIINFDFTRGSIFNLIKSSFKLIKTINNFNSDLLVLTDPSTRIAIPTLLSNSKKKVIAGLIYIQNLFIKKKKFRKKFLSSNLFELKKRLKLKNYQNKYDIKIRETKKNYTNRKFKCRIKIFFNIDSHHNHNNWGVKNFNFLITECLKYSSKIFINFSPKNMKMKSNFSSNIKNNKNVFFTYKEKISKIIKLIGKCDVIIGNESGPICIGASMNKNVYSLYSKKFSRPESMVISKKIKYYVFNDKNSNIILKKIVTNIKKFLIKK